MNRPGPVDLIYTFSGARWFERQIKHNKHFSSGRTKQWKCKKKKKKQTQLIRHLSRLMTIKNTNNVRHENIKLKRVDTDRTIKIVGIEMAYLNTC